MKKVLMQLLAIVAVVLIISFLVLLPLSIVCLMVDTMTWLFSL